MAEELDELRRRLGARRAPPRRPGKIKLDVPARRSGPSSSEAFDVRLVEQTTASWEFYFGLLQTIRRARGPCAGSEAPARGRLQARPVGQRSSASVPSRSNLDPERQRAAGGLPGWTWDANEAAWEEGFAHLQRFVEREGHARVPPRYREEDGFRLGEWVWISARR